MSKRVLVSWMVHPWTTLSSVQGQSPYVHVLFIGCSPRESSRGLVDVRKVIEGAAGSVFPVRGDESAVCPVADGGSRPVHGGGCGPGVDEDLII